MRRLLLALAILTACSKGSEPPAPSTGRPNAQPETGPGSGASRPVNGGGDGEVTPAVEAKQMFITVCATCHGTDGTGNGPVSESLDPKPRNYTDPTWQASVTDDDLRAIILGGGTAVGKSAMMPAQHQLKDRPEVLTELIKIIRAYAKAP